MTINCLFNQLGIPKCRSEECKYYHPDLEEMKYPSHIHLPKIMHDAPYNNIHYRSCSECEAPSLKLSLVFKYNKFGTNDLFYMCIYRCVEKNCGAYERTNFRSNPTIIEDLIEKLNSAETCFFVDSRKKPFPLDAVISLLESAKRNIEEDE